MITRKTEMGEGEREGGRGKKRTKKEKLTMAKRRERFVNK